MWQHKSHNVMSGVLFHSARTPTGSAVCKCQAFALLIRQEKSTQKCHALTKFTTTVFPKLPTAAFFICGSAMIFIDKDLNSAIAKNKHKTRTSNSKSCSMGAALLSNSSKCPEHNAWWVDAEQAGIEMIGEVPLQMLR